MIRSAAEEVFQTVSAIPGTLARLGYLTNLQMVPGVYHHWGIEKEHGEKATQAAFRSAHHLILETILQTGFSELLMEIELNADDEDLTATEWVGRLAATPCLDLCGCTEPTYLHFRFILASLQALLAHSA